MLNVCNIYNFVFSQVSSQVLVKQWNNLVQTLVATVIADKPAAEKANDTELCAIAKRLTAVRTYEVKFFCRNFFLVIYKKKQSVVRLAKGNVPSSSCN